MTFNSAHTQSITRVLFLGNINFDKGFARFPERLPGKSRGLADGEGFHKTEIQQKKKAVSEAVLKPNSSEDTSLLICIGIRFYEHASKTY